MNSARELVDRLVDLIVNPLILLVFAAGFFLFMWGLVKFLWFSREGEIDDSGKSHMIWGVVGMFVMVSVYGIIALVTNTFGINQHSATNTSNVDRLSPGVRLR